MTAVGFSRAAEEDLWNIAQYTLREWGKAQALRYLGEMETCCRRLTDYPQMGRACDDLFPGLKPSGLRRMEQGSHVIFYRQRPEGILVSRILHKSMLPGRHSLDDES